MKRLLFSLATACTLGLGSCQKDLDQAPISNGSTLTFYQTATDFSQAMTAVYSNLRGYPDRTLFMSEIRSDNFYAVSSLGVRDWDGINNFVSTLSINPYISDTWASDYSTIFRANTMLDQLAGAGAITGALRPRYEGEAKFIRAMMYFDLVRYFGKVPLVDHVLSPQATAQMQRTDVAKVYELIISDLQTAIANLPATYAATDVGRATKGAAQTLLAQVYLTRSGPTYGINGPGLGLNEYALANTLLDQVIASKAYSLQGTYPRVFAFSNENNSEVIFDIQYIANGTLGGSYNATLATNQYLPYLGLAFASNAVENKPVSADVISTYATADARLTFNVLPSFTYQSIAYSTPLLKKYIDVASRGTSYSDWGLNFIVLRYADVLTMKAECILHGVGGTTADALALTNQLRTRASVPALTSLTINDLLAERRREFLGEGLRWHDLVREGVVLDVMNAWVLKEDVALKITRPIGANMIIYPVPQIELASAPGVYTQNPGY
ncbi:MAG: RagB/SusD family nutrient uptake outer membrane protein [Cytophagaceae bacterium]|nr:MAG: RagB/SusD family nutrient uptake outer membrane protein [Cytophagaceae bacterium]